MLNIKSILEFVKNGVESKDPRFITKDDEHLLDKTTGATYHVYDTWFKVTQDGINIITADDFTTAEQRTVWDIKKEITPPDVMKQREANFKELQKSRREAFSDLYEFPSPISDKNPEPEEDTDVYTG